MKQLNPEDSLLTLLHDLRGPINTVLSVNHLFSKELQSLSVGVELDYYETVRHSCHKALQLIDDVLETSKMEADEYNMQIATY